MTVTKKEESALEYLEKDFFLHIGMIEPIRRGHAEILYAQEDGVLIRELNSNAYMLSVSKPEVGETLISGISNTELFVVYQEFCIPFVKNKFHLNEIMDCVQAVYTSRKTLPVRNDINIECLDLSWVNTITEHYHTVDNADYIQKLLKNGFIFGAFIDEILVGFIGMHDEGSMGLLEVFPQYRRRGIGAALESYMVNSMLEKGWTPFGQVINGNSNSINLQKKLGFKISDKHMYWLTRI